jgi:hypothetical protein
MAYPSVYPTGTTIYDPEKCWNGYTIFQAKEVGATLIDTILPGGFVMGNSGLRSSQYGMQDQVDLVQVDWEGNIVWKFDKYEYIEDPGEEPRWMARQHHDFQREGCPVGYYVPGMEPFVDKGNTMILSHKNVHNPEITDKLLCDDTIIEVNWDGDVIWEWICSEHFAEMGFSEEARNILSRNPNMRPAGGGVGDWMHINSMSLLGLSPGQYYLGWPRNRHHCDNGQRNRQDRLADRARLRYFPGAARAGLDYRPASCPHDSQGAAG